MNLPQIILNTIAKATPREPMALAELQKRLNIDLSTLNPIIDAMAIATPASINRAEITRGGTKDFYIWPTGIIDKISYRDYYVSPKKPTLPTQPIRTELIKKEPDVSHIKYPATQIIAEAIKHQSIHMDALIEKLIGKNTEDQWRAKDMVKYCVKIEALTKNSDGYLAIGTNEVWLHKNGFGDAKQPTYPPKTPGALDSAEAIKALEQVHNTNIIGTCFPTSKPKDVVQVQDGPAIKNLVENFDAAPQVKADKIRFAITNDGVLMIFGIGYQPIELTAADTRDLVTFIEAAAPTLI